MAERTKQVAISVSEAEKRQIRQAAAAAGQSMSAFVRQRALDGLEVPEQEAPDTYSPLEDFIASRLAVDSDADPIAKRRLYERYVAFCDDVYPEHEVETQHKFTREIGNVDGVGTGRVYLSADEPNPTRTRCFKNLRLRKSGELEF
jgi:hypothetical protein